MATCETCGNDYDKAFQVVMNGQQHTFDELVMRELRYFTDSPDQPPFLKALAEVRRIGVHEGWCYQHVQAIMLAIDQYAEAVTGNRAFFLE